jgi:coenzyme F420-reducing hydrogenase delta subunit
VDPKRVQMYNVSAAMAAEFIKSATSMTELLKDMGQNPLKNNS